jgi:hypothetical protein
VALVIAAAFLAALAVGRGRQRRATRSWLVDNAAWIRTWRSQPTPVVVAVVIWTLVIAATVGWDLVSFIVQSHTLPTLSYYIGHVTRYQIGRGVCFGLWLAAGGYLAAGWRARVPQ